MAVKAKKKAAATRTARKKTSAKKKTTAKKKTPARRKSPAGQVKKGDKYQCSVCGIAVRIDETCGCVDMCDIICCDTQMKPKKK